MKFPFHEGVRCGALRFFGFVQIQKFARPHDHRDLKENRSQRVFEESQGIADATMRYVN